MTLLRTEVSYVLLGCQTLGRHGGQHHGGERAESMRIVEVLIDAVKNLVLAAEGRRGTKVPLSSDARCF